MFFKTFKNLKIYYIGLFLIILGAIILYFQSFKTGFISDDFNLIFNYPKLINPFSGERWNPILGAYYWLINIYHFQPLVFRIIFFIFHLINILLVFIITNLLTKRRLVGLLAAFIFALFYRHPMVIYLFATSWETFCGIFVLLTILFFVLYCQTKKYSLLFASLLFFLLALLSKESAIVTPLILFLISFLSFEKKNSDKLKLALKQTLPFIGLSIIYLIFNFITIKKGLPFIFEKGSYHLVGFKKAMANYINLWIGLLPIKFNLENNSSILFNTGFTIISLITLIILFIKKSIGKEIKLFLGIILITFLPYIFFGTWGYRENYLYLPSFAFSGLLAYLIYLVCLKIKSKLKIFFLIFVLTIWGLISYNIISWRSAQWLEADQITKKIQDSMIPYCPFFNSDSKAYFINFPNQLNDQVFLFNNGVFNMIKFTCRKEGIGQIYEIQVDETTSLSTYGNYDSAPVSLLILAYENNQVINYSNKIIPLEILNHAD